MSRSFRCVVCRKKLIKLKIHYVPVSCVLPAVGRGVTSLLVEYEDEEETTGHKKKSTTFCTGGGAGTCHEWVMDCDFLSFSSSSSF